LSDAVILNAPSEVIVIVYANGREDCANASATVTALVSGCAMAFWCRL
jgi:hypothetical protein